MYILESVSWFEVCGDVQYAVLSESSSFVYVDV